MNLFVGVHFFLILAIISAVRVKMTNPGKIPEKYSKEKEDVTYKALINRDPELTQKLFGTTSTQIKACN